MALDGTVRQVPASAEVASCWRVLAGVPDLVAAAQGDAARLPAGLTWDLLLDALRGLFQVQLFVLARRAHVATEAAPAAAPEAAGGEAADALFSLQPWAVALLTPPDAPLAPAAPATADAAAPRKRKVWPGHADFRASGRRA